MRLKIPFWRSKPARKEAVLLPRVDIQTKEQNTVVVIDLENLIEASGSGDFDKRLRDFGRFLDYLAFQLGERIIALNIFYPPHLGEKMRSVLYHLYNARLTRVHTNIVKETECPRNWASRMGSSKQMDMVDIQIYEYVLWLLEFVPSMTKIVVVSNDGDFNRVRQEVKRRGVKFTLFPASELFSRDFLATSNGSKEVATEFLRGGSESGK